MITNHTRYGLCSVRSRRKLRHQWLGLKRVKSKPVAVSVAHQSSCLRGSLKLFLLLICGPALHLASVKYDFKSLVKRSHRSCRFAVAYLLLIVIGYGALVEAVHTHGRVSASNANVEAAYDAGRSQSSTQKYSDQKECSTCQFQRQLFDGFVSVAPFART